MALLLDWSAETKRDLDRLFTGAKDPTPVMQDFGEYKRRKIILLMPSKPKGEAAASGEAPARHSAGLSKTITYNATARGLEVGTTDVRGRLLQEGGVVRPKRARALTVPVAKESYGKRAADFTGLFLVKRDGTRPLLARTRGKAPELQVLFVLLDQVKINPHPFLFWTGEDEERLQTLVQRHFERAS